MVEFGPLELGARPMAGHLTLDQTIEVRILCPQLRDSQILEGLLFLEMFLASSGVTILDAAGWPLLDNAKLI